jgi:hypothetical protein
MIVRRQFGNSNDVHSKNNFVEGVWQGDDELCRGVSVSGKPVNHPGVGIVVVGVQRTVTRVSFPVGVREPSGVLVVRIARVGVLERRLPKGEEQARHYAQMEKAAHR